MRDIRRMPWGELVLMLQAHAHEFDEEEDQDDGPRQATWDEIKAWM